MNKIQSKTVVMNRTDIDTDQIIPARFLTTTTREGLGANLFADWRYQSDGSNNPTFILNDPQFNDASVLVAGRNFGCGSSREHAPWALTDYGFRAVISSEIADIFRSNSLKNGLLPITVSNALHKRLLDASCTVHIDLESRRIDIMDNDTSVAGEHFDIDNFSRFCLMQETDQLGFLLDQLPHIEQFEQRQKQGPHT